MITVEVTNLPQLIAEIAIGCSSSEKGPQVRRLGLWDGRTMTATYDQGEPDIVARYMTVLKDQKLEQLVDELLKGQREAIVIERGFDDELYTLRWTFE